MEGKGEGGKLFQIADSGSVIVMPTVQHFHILTNISTVQASMGSKCQQFIIIKNNCFCQIS